MPFCVYVYAKNLSNVQETYPGSYFQPAYSEDFPIDGKGFTKTLKLYSLSFDGYTPEIEINHGPWTLGKGETSTNPNQQFFVSHVNLWAFIRISIMSMLTLQTGTRWRSCDDHWNNNVKTVSLRYKSWNPKNYHGKMKVLIYIKIWVIHVIPP